VGDPRERLEAQKICRILFVVFTVFGMT